MNNSRFNYRFLVSFFSGVLLSAIVILLWYVNQREQEVTRSKTVQDTGQLITRQFEGRVLESIQSLQNLKSRIEITDGRYFDYWQHDAYLIFRQNSSFMLLEWIDKDMIIRRIEPEKGNGNALGLDLSELDYRRADWEKARDDSVVNLTHWLQLVQGPMAFLVDAPVYYQDEFKGTITAAVDFKSGFDTIMQGLDQYYVKLKDENGVVFYEYGTREKVTENGLFQDVISFDPEAITSGNWTITVVSDHNPASTKAGNGLLLNLLLGLILSVITGTMIYYMLTVNAARVKAKLANLRIRHMIENSPMAMYAINEDGIITDFWNEAAENLLGWKREEVMGKFIPQIPGNDRKEFEEVMKERALTGSVRNKEVVRVRKDGSKICIRLNVGQIVLDSENEQQMLVTLEDVTREKEYQRKLENSLEEKGVLLSEVHHRVKNNLAIITGLIELQKSEIKDEELNSILKDTQNRIYSIASVHELLYNADSFIEIVFADYGSKLIDRIREMFTSDDRKIAITQQFETNNININQAIPLGLLMNELITNSFKHAFTGMKAGSIHIQIKESDGFFEMVYKDDGKGFDISKFDNTGSLGVTLIKTLIEQLNAEYEIDTVDKFYLKLRFEKKDRGSHSNL